MVPMRWKPLPTIRKEQPMVASMRLYFDFEFTGLHQHTTPISLGIVAGSGHTFYAEFNDYDQSQVDPWIQENVIDRLQFNDRDTVLVDTGAIFSMKDTKENITTHLTEWMSRWANVQMWGDCMAYDWVLFCQLYGGALNIPKNVYYIPFDLATVLALAHIDPDVSREEFVPREYGKPHTALHDAQVIRSCLHRLWSDLGPRM
jgi:hypothetical protein